MKAGMYSSGGSPSSRRNSTPTAFSSGLRSQFPAHAGSSNARLASRSGLAAAIMSAAAPPPEYPTRWKRSQPRAFASFSAPAISDLRL